MSKKSNASFCPYDQAHLFCGDTTKKYAAIIHQVLASAPYQHQFICFKEIKIPFKPLIGVKAPAVAIEAGLKKLDDWHKYLEPIAHSLQSIIEQNLEHT